MTCKHKWRWNGGGISGPDFEDQMYCRKKCEKCGEKREIRETRKGAAAYLILSPEERIKNQGKKDST